MASFSFLVPFIMALMATLSLSLSSELKLDMLTISAAPALLPSLPPSEVTELPPDIAPLFPSPGGAVPSSTGSIPTIPSNPSPPNPDEMVEFGPGNALSPSGSLPASSGSFCNISRCLNLALFMGLMAFCSVLVFAM